MDSSAGHGSEVEDDVGDPYGPLHLAASTRNVELLASSLAEVSTPAVINRQDVHGRTALMEACQAGCVECTLILLNAGANTTACDWLQKTALHYAAAAGHAEIVDILLESGADPHARDGRERCPLHLCLECKQVLTAKLLLNRVPRDDIHVVDILAHTFLHKV
eukprot:gene17044-20264_t